MKTNTILITGGAGFIGINFILYMLEKYPYYKFLCLDKLSYAANVDEIYELDRIYNNFKFIEGNICDKYQVMEIFSEYKPNIVVNFAAESHVDRSIDAPDVFFHSNLIGATVLLNACVGNNNIRFHQVSTDEVYGDLPLDETLLKFTEKSPLLPSSPYSASKAGADMAVLAYHRTYGMDVTISRCGNNYGPYQFQEKLIPLMITNAVLGKELPVYGNGKNIRDWVYVKDHCEAIDTIIHNGRSGEIYNVGSNTEISNLDLVRKICQELGKSEDLITFVEDRKGHDLRYALDATKIKNELGWIPKMDFENGLKKTIAWYVNELKN